jgi:hypothetical protein
MIRVLIHKDGSIDKEELILLDCPHTILARSCCDVIVNQWTFKPAMKDGNPIDCRANIEVHFRTR